MISFGSTLSIATMQDLSLMLPQLGVFTYLIGFFLFVLGLFSVSQFTGAFRTDVVDSFLSGYEISLRPVRFLIGIILFSAFCNAVLLIPAAAELFCNVQANVALTMHRLCLIFLSFCSVLLVLLGLIVFLRLCNCNFPSFCLKDLPIAPKIFELGVVGKKEVILLSIAIGAFLYSSVSSEYIYDTGLYHFPLVKHLVEFGPEIGLGNLHSRFAFYNIQLFGQVPLQAFGLDKTYVSPSLNILFFFGLLMFAADAILGTVRAEAKASLQQDPNFNAVPACIKIIIVVIYWLAVLLLGLTSEASLISYDADFSSAIVASIVAFCLVTGSFMSREIFFLLVCLPLLKLSSLVFVFYAFLFLLMLYVCKFVIGARSRPIPGLEQFKKVLCGMRGWPAAVLLFLGFLYLATNITLSGYLVFPEYKTGPIGSHAVPYADVVTLKNRWITGWARFRFDDEPREIIENAPSHLWLPSFVSSPNGVKILIWISLSFITAAWSLSVMNFWHREVQYIMLFASSVAVGCASALVLLVLPPDPRFYTWINGLVAFNFIQLAILAFSSRIGDSPTFVWEKTPLPQGELSKKWVPSAPWLTIGSFLRRWATIIPFFALALSAAILSKSSLARMKPPSLQMNSLARGQIVTTWRPRSIHRDLTIRISRPTSGDQCWNAPPPCTPYQAFIRNDAEAEPAAIR